MAETLGTKDVLEQVDARLGNVEQDIRELRSEMKTEIRDLRAEMSSRFQEMNGRFDRVYQEIGGLRVELRWMYGLLVAVLLGVAGLWFK